MRRFKTRGFLNAHSHPYRRCLIAAASILIATPAEAAPATVYIYKVYFDSPGKDTGSNTSLNAEYVVIRNGDNVSHSVSGWTVRDAAGHVYKFGTLKLGAGKQAIIHTGRGTSTRPLPVRTCIEVGARMCGTTLVTR